MVVAQFYIQLVYKTTLSFTLLSQEIIIKNFPKKFIWEILIDILVRTLSSKFFEKLKKNFTHENTALKITQIAKTVELMFLNVAYLYSYCI